MAAAHQQRSGCNRPLMFAAGQAPDNLAQHMKRKQYRPTLPATRIMLYIAALLVFAVGFSLYVFTDQTERHFAWTVGSLLTAAFLGGSYWSAVVLEFLSARERLWAYSRPSIPAVTVFTYLTLIVTLVHRDKFHFDAPLAITRAGTWFWLFIYASVPIVLTILFVLQTRQPGADPPRRFPLTRWTRLLLIALAALFFLLGVTLLVVPTAVVPYWPWPLTELTARAIGAWLAGLCLITGQAAWENDLRRLRAVMASLVAFVLLQLGALARYGVEMDWENPTAWLYIVILLLLGLIGLYELIRSWSLPNRS